MTTGDALAEQADAHGAAATLVRKLWQYCNVLRDDGLSYPDYVEQLTYLLFLKMADEQKDSPVRKKHAWSSFARLGATDLHRHYSRVLSALGREAGALGLIFHGAKNKIRDPRKLRRLVVDLIGQTDWTGLSADVKGDAYEGLLEKNARDTKSGAGQYFTPRPLIDAIVACVDPRVGEVVCDPACGTGGFLLAAHAHMRKSGPRASGAQRRVPAGKVRGVELVPEVARLAAMNLLLHGVVGADSRNLPIRCADSLEVPPDRHADVVLTNPPFGVKGSVTYSDRAARENDDLTVLRRDFWVQTANKQLNFVQHIVSLLKPGGRGAVVVPDNVLFEAGAAGAIRRRLFETCAVHTLLRLPAGLFYAQGVQANVLFFDRVPRGRTSASPSSSPTARKRAAAPDQRPLDADRQLWVYDLRAGNRFSLKTRPLSSGDLEEFVALYRSRRAAVDQKARGTPESSRWRAFQIADILASENCSLDMAWLQPEMARARADLSSLNEISRAIMSDLQRAMEHVALAGVTPKVK